MPADSSISGDDLGDVRVHAERSTPLGAQAQAMGGDIHIAMGQQHAATHEAWHVVQSRPQVKPFRSN